MKLMHRKKRVSFSIVATNFLFLFSNEEGSPFIEESMDMKMH
jgi:hypothetical protein